MSKWEKFEMECTQYLNNNFGKYANFIHQGGADSTVPDIFVETTTGNKFYIEGKASPAQCGQFVLLPNIENKVFEYSAKNINSINKYAIKIMEHMNLYFDEFRNAGTAGKEISMENGSQIFSEWIIDNYRGKNVRLFITNNYIIFPIEYFTDYFEVNAKYRIKRSGSSSVGKSLVGYFEELFTGETSNKYKITSTRKDGSKLFVSSDEDLHDTRFIYKGNEYMFSRRGLEFEIRKLSNTYNANVIFSIKLKENVTGLRDGEIVEFLK